MAFPTTSILDSFDRADENPVTGWLTSFVNFADALPQIVSNQLKGSFGDQLYNIYYTAATYGPHSEAYVTVGTKPDASYEVGVSARLINISQSTTDGYHLQVFPVAGGANDSWVLNRVDNGGLVILTSGTQEITNGDKIGIECEGSTIRAWYFNGTTWAQILSVTDGTYAGAGRIGVGLFSNTANTTPILNDFSGGTAVVAGTGPMFRGS